MRYKNSQSVLLKNVLDACVGAIMWYVCGYGFAFGNIKHDDPNKNGYIGRDYFFGLNLVENHQCHLWVFHYAFACTSATIVSGSLAERVNLRTYIVFSMLITGWIYPVVAHWYWGRGWLYDLGY